MICFYWCGGSFCWAYNVVVILVYEITINTWTCFFLSFPFWCHSRWCCRRLNVHILFWGESGEQSANSNFWPSWYELTLLTFAHEDENIYVLIWYIWAKLRRSLQVTANRFNEYKPPNSKLWALIMYPTQASKFY